MSANHHTCPGNCGRMVAQTKLACRDCWYRLPRMLQLAVTDGYAKRRRNLADATAHRLALAEALAWYRDNMGREVPS